MGSLTLVVGSFVGAAIDPEHDLGAGVLYAGAPAIIVGTLMAYSQATNPVFAARVMRYTTGAAVPIAAGQ